MAEDTPKKDWESVLTESLTHKTGAGGKTPSKDAPPPAKDAKPARTEAPKPEAPVAPAAPAAPASDFNP